MRYMTSVALVLFLLLHPLLRLLSRLLAVRAALVPMSSNFTVQQHRRESRPLSYQLGSTARRLADDPSRRIFYF